MAGETNPIRPLIIPEREVDFIIIYEASSDAKYHWVNGTNLISRYPHAEGIPEQVTNRLIRADTAESAHEGNIPFPAIPDVDTMITQNFTKQPTFFGCNYTDSTPLVLYLPNSPWTSYSNYSFKQNAFSNKQLNLTLENSFQLATYGNRSIDENWPACLACASIRGSLRRMKMDLPKQCETCFDKHCWDGKESSDGVTEQDQDPSLRLDPGLSYQEWNDTEWNRKSSGGAQGGEGNSQDESDGDDQAASLLSLPPPSIFYLTFVLATVAVVFG